MVPTIRGSATTRERIMLNNGVRFGNMKRVNRAVWALAVILVMVLGLVLAGCSGSSDGADGKEESTIRKLPPSPRKGVRCLT